MASIEEKSILVIGAHPDDECLGTGGTILSHTVEGIPVDMLCLTGNETRNDELRAVCAKLGVRNLYLSERDDFEIDTSLTHEIIGAILKTRPTIIITHSSNDYNQDHENCSMIVDQAVEWASHVTLFDDAHRVERIYHMEVNTLLPRPNIFVEITKYYATAVSALQEHKSQIGKADEYYLKLYDARTRLRGVQSACKRAEAFSITIPEHGGPFYPKNFVDRLI